MKLLVIGANGFIGSRLMELWPCDEIPIGGTYHSHPPDDRYINLKRWTWYNLDIRDRDQVVMVLADFDPDTIVIAAAISNAGMVKQDPINANSVNVEGVRNILDSALERYIVYLSTDNIFDGTSGPYRETDEPLPICLYGSMKLAGERLVLGHGNSLIIRTSFVYKHSTGPKTNFVNHLITRLSNGEEITAWVDQFLSPVYIDDFIDGMFQLIARRSTGITHLAGPEHLSRYEMARIVCEVFELDPGLVTKGSLAEQKDLSDIPKKIGLDSLKAEQLIDYAPRSFREGLMEMKRTIRPRNQ